MSDAISVKVSFDPNSPLGAVLAGMRPRFRSGLVRTLAESSFQSTGASPTPGNHVPAPTPRRIEPAPHGAAGHSTASKVVEQPSLAKVSGGAADHPEVPASVAEPVQPMNRPPAPAPTTAHDVAVETPDEKRARLRRTFKNLGLNIR